jgi:hypothetical protein
LEDGEMPDEANTTVAQEGKEQNNSTTQVVEEEFDKDRALATIRKLRENEKATKAQLKELADLKAAQAAAEEKRLKETGDYQKIAEDAQKKVAELEPHKARADEAEEALNELLAEQRKDLPAHVAELLDGKSPAAQLKWIAKHRAELAKPTPPNINAGGGAGGKTTDAPNDAEKASIAARYGVDPKYIR